MLAHLAGASITAIFITTFKAEFARTAVAVSRTLLLWAIGLGTIRAVIAALGGRALSAFRRTPGLLALVTAGTLLRILTARLGATLALLTLRLVALLLIALRRTLSLFSLGCSIAFLAGRSRPCRATHPLEIGIIDGLQY